MWLMRAMWPLHGRVRLWGRPQDERLVLKMRQQQFVEMLRQHSPEGDAAALGEGPILHGISTAAAVCSRA